MPRKPLERDFNKHLTSELNRRFPGNVTLKQDAGFMNGVPDKLVLYRDRWALLESKRGLRAAKQPLQQERVDMFDDMSFSAFINPENCDEVLDQLEDHFHQD